MIPAFLCVPYDWHIFDDNIVLHILMVGHWHFWLYVFHCFAHVYILEKEELVRYMSVLSVNKILNINYSRSIRLIISLRSQETVNWKYTTDTKFRFRNEWSCIEQRLSGLESTKEKISKTCRDGLPFGGLQKRVQSLCTKPKVRFSYVSSALLLYWISVSSGNRDIHCEWSCK